MKHGSFLFFFYATLVAGFGAVGSPFAFVLLAGLVLAHGAQRSLFGRRHFPEDVAVTETGQEDIYYRGSYIPTNIGAQKEKRFLQSVYGTHNPTLAKATMGFMLGLLTFTGHRVPGTTWSGATVFEMLAVVSVIPIAGFSQYLIPLFFSAAGVLLARQAVDFWSVVLTVVYGVGFCVTCAAHGFEEKRIGEKAINGQLNSWPTILKNAATAFGVFCAIYLAVDAVLPSHRPMSEEALYTTADRLNHLSVKKDLDGRMPGHLRRQSQGPNSSVAMGTVADKPSTSGEGSSLDFVRGLSKKVPGQDTKEPSQNPNQITFDPSQKISLPRPEFAGKFRGDDGSTDKLPSGGGNANDAELTRPPLARGLEPNLQDGGKKTITQNDVDQERRQVKQAIENKGDDLTVAAAETAKNPQAPRRQPSDVKIPLLNGPEAKEAESGKPGAPSAPGEGTPVGGDRALGETARDAVTAASTGAPPNPEDAKPEPPPRPFVSEPTLMALLTIFKFLFAVACAWVVYVYFTRSSKGSRRTRRPPLSRDQRVLLAAEIKNFAQLRVKNRDGIIQGYQIFLKVMAAAQLPKEDYLPPADYAVRLKRTWPRFDESFSIITDVFSDAFYGESLVAEQRVSQYELALKRVMSAVIG